MPLLVEIAAIRSAIRVSFLLNNIQFYCIYFQEGSPCPMCGESLTPEGSAVPPQSILKQINPGQIGSHHTLETPQGRPKSTTSTIADAADDLDSIRR